MTGAQVHEAARDVLRFWFEETPPERRFAKDDDFDAAIQARFGELRDRVVASGAAGWDDRPETLLAAIILIDQFSRNLFRGSAEAFASDAKARTVAGALVATGGDMALTPVQRAFAYLPFDRIKIDKSFVMSKDHNPESLAIVKTIASLGESLNLPITAEGIEDEFVAERLFRLGCAKGQGYLFGRPLSLAHTRRLLAELRLIGGPQPTTGTAITSQRLAG